jgi:phasin family protein
MQQQLFDMSNAFNQQAFEAANKLADITVRTYGKLMQQQVDVAGLCWESGVKQLELVHDAKDVPSYLRTQSEMAKDSTNQALEANQKTLDILVEARNELKAWLEQSMAWVTREAKPAAVKKVA